MHRARRWPGSIVRLPAPDGEQQERPASVASAGWQFSAERLPRFAAPVAVAAIAAATLIPLANPYPLTSKAITWPTRLVSSLQQSVPKGGVVLALPYVTSSTNAPMAWQAMDRMKFRIIGGYATVPNPAGGGNFHVAPTEALTLFDLAVSAAGSGTLATNTSTASALAVHACEAVPEVLREFSVNAVVVWPSGSHQSLVSNFLKPVLGMPSRHFGQALVWYGVQHDLARHPQCGTESLMLAMPTKSDWLSFLPRCWTPSAGSGTVVRRRTLRGRGTAHVLAAVGHRPTYTFGEIHFARPLDWMHSNYIHVTYKGTGSGKVYQIYFEFSPSEVAKYSIVDDSDQWQTASFPTAQRGLPPAAWSHLSRIGLALSPKSATGTIVIGCPAPSKDPA